MGSLSAHFREAGDHGRLPFHPNCPVCRQERLYGSLSSEPVVPRRAQALLAGGVLAISSSAPAVTLAQEPDRQFEGVTAPEAPGGAELDDPSFDPGGDTALSFDTAPAPAAPEGGEDSGVGAPLDAEPTVDLDAGLAPDEEPGAPVTETTAPPTDEEAGVPPVGSVPSAGPQPPPTAPATPPAEPPAPVGGEATTPPVESPDARENMRSRADRPAPPPPVDDEAHEPADTRRAGTPPATSAPPAAAPPAAAPPAPPAASSAPSLPAAEPVAVAEVDVAPPTDAPKPLDRNARFYVVQPGDSLWSIAKRLVGTDASPARVARAVNRLWSLNRDRIATGDPDLLMVGTRLDLR